ncbi:hypothetical protein TNCV_2702301 [Trichonephila clavipes]|nr:hypothetical protein TNCV_2702301 [Trichonephila clavipes]
MIPYLTGTSFPSLHNTQPFEMSADESSTWIHVIPVALPGSNHNGYVGLREYPDVDLADASKTTLSFVVLGISEESFLLSVYTNENIRIGDHSKKVGSGQLQITKRLSDQEESKLKCGRLTITILRELTYTGSYKLKILDVKRGVNLTSEMPSLVRVT